MSRSLVDKVIRLCESRGFSVESRIEGSLGTAYSYLTYHFGPLGTELRRNLRNAWWYDVVRSKGNVYGFETANELITHACDQTPITNSERAVPLSENSNALAQLFRVVPGIKVPFGAAWNRKYFRKPENDNFILRSCDREVMTLQYFCAENRVDDWTNHWKRQRLMWWRKFANVRSNYSFHEEQSNLEPGLISETFIQYNFPWGKESIDSITVRSDLHKRMTNEECNGLPFSKESIPYEIQIKTDLNRGFLAFLMDAYLEKERSDSSGNVSLCTVLHLHPQLAPIKVAVVPQISEQNELCKVAEQLSSELRQADEVEGKLVVYIPTGVRVSGCVNQADEWVNLVSVNCMECGIEFKFVRFQIICTTECSRISTECSLHTSADECYTYQDEIGTPYCITILDTTLTNGIVMFRSRNTTLQEYTHMSDILSSVKSHLGL